MVMQDKICLVTGASDGIGLITARELVRQGAEVVIHGRSADKGRHAVAEIERQTGKTVRFIQGDFASLGAVRDLARQVGDSVPRLDVLVNNAGRAASTVREVSQDGYEMIFAVNHLAPFLLTHLLLDKLKAAPTARVVNVASVAHKFKPLFDIDDLMSEKIKPINTYSRSKFANILFSDELARRLAGTAITSNALHPGTIRSNFGNEATVTRIFYKFAAPLLKTPEQGALTNIYLAASPEVEGRTGGYYADCKPAEPHPATRDVEIARRLWEKSERLVGI
ncbi:MAG: SDR family oxidoreductase [Porticoccaceae bacterium]|jgi:NAD(P)-dependent dehydrogenase (short-subunit alcohol dehydrogenase family)